MSIVLPPELVLLCLAALPLTDSETIPTLVATSLGSTSLLLLSRSNTLWRPLLEHHFHQHRPSSAHALQAVQQNETDDDETAAYRLFVYRSRTNARAATLVEQIQQPLHRLPLIAELRALGGGGSDLIESPRFHPAAFTPESHPETWIASQYWAGEVRKVLLRDEAAGVWKGIVERDERGEEREDDFEKGLDAFAAFRGLDSMLLSKQRYALSNHRLFVDSVSSPLHTGPRRLEWLANEVMSYMLDLGLEAAQDGSFHALENHYVEEVWRRADEGAGEGGSLPMTLVAIFCALVRRLPVVKALGIRVKPIGMPGTVLAGLAYEGEDEWTYVNVFSGRVIKIEAMRSMLAAMQLPPSPEYFQPASARSMCIRVARNILTSVRQGERLRGIPISHEDATSSLYSVAHALFLLSPSSSSAESQTYADWLVSLVQAEFTLDVGFLESEVVPRMRDMARRERVERLCREIREEDGEVREKKWVSARIEHRIGTVFRHRLFGYTALIRGWDYTCEASEQWIQQMRVDTLPFGRDQPFYHVLRDDGGSLYVASENITGWDIADAAVDGFLDNPSLGRYFRKRERDERGRWVFVKSAEVEAEYPDS